MSTYDASRRASAAAVPGADDPAIDPLDDALWHLQREVDRLTRLVSRHGLNPAQRRDLARLLAALRAAAEWHPPHRRKTAPETEPAL